MIDLSNQTKSNSSNQKTPVYDINSNEFVTKSNAFRYFNKMRADCAKQCNGQAVRFNKSEVAGSGKISGEHPDRLEVGVRGFNENSKSSWRVNRVKFTAVLVAIPHESRHYMQWSTISRQNDKLGKIMCVSNNASLLNPVYYDKNYFWDPREVDAERYGINKAYHFCADYFGEEVANDMICDYVNVRIRKRISFIRPEYGKKYDSVKDILVDFDKAFEDSLMHERVYDFKEGLKKHEPLAVILNGDVFKKDKKAFSDEKCGLIQDMVAAAITMSQYENDSSFIHHPAFFNTQVNDVLYGDIRNQIFPDIFGSPPADESDVEESVIIASSDTSENKEELKAKQFAKSDDPGILRNGYMSEPVELDIKEDKSIDEEEYELVIEDELEEQGSSLK